MGLLKIKEECLEKKTLVIRNVLSYFDAHEESYSNLILEKISKAADEALMDDILFEEFENWASNRDDESFIYLINHYWESKATPSLSRGDLTGLHDEILDIKKEAKKSVAKNFSIILQELCNKKNFRTYREIGDFLGGITEERVRILLDGKHKPQRRTILNVAEKFRLDPNELMKMIVG